MATIKKSGDTSWAGEAELSAALVALSSGTASEPDLVKKAAQVSVKFQNEYKMVVFELEKFIKKSKAEDKLAGILVIDLICKIAQGKDKDVFCARFGTRLKQIFACLHDLSPEDKIKFDKVIEEWRKKSYFPQTLLPDAKEGGIDSEVPTPSSRADDISAAAPKPSTTRIKRKLLRLCPFREGGNCPFGEKCRFDHDQNTQWLETVPKRTKRKPMSTDTSSLNQYGDASVRILPRASDVTNPAFVLEMLGPYPLQQIEGSSEPELKKFVRTKLNCVKRVGNASFTVIDDSLFQHLVGK